MLKSIPEFSSILVWNWKEFKKNVMLRIRRNNPQMSVVPYRVMIPFY